YASDELCADEQVVLAAVEQDGNAMRYASPSLKADPVFALEAVRKSSEAILYVSRELRQDKQFTLQAALSGCSRDLLDPRLRVWLEQRDELLARMRAAIDGQDVFGVREVIKDGEEHGLSDEDLLEPRRALKKLIKYSEVGSLWEPLRRREGDREPPIVLIRGSWLAKLAKEGGRLPRRQELPPEAIWDCDELERDAEEFDKGRHRLATRVVAISYCWLRCEHPDPCGTQLAAAGALASSCLEELGDGVDLAIFLDYCSLFQEPRTEMENEVFQESLQHVAIWYAHKKTQVWVLTVTPETCGLPVELGGTEVVELPVLPYDVRGWPNFERNVAELLACEGGAGQSILLINEGALEQLLQPDRMPWPEVLDAFKANQEPPKVPDAFCDLLATKTFTASEDLKMLQAAGKGGPAGCWSRGRSDAVGVGGVGAGAGRAAAGEAGPGPNYNDHACFWKAKGTMTL
ncbi:P4HTM, partial [Symbiodinium pilosum]